MKKILSSGVLFATILSTTLSANYNDKGTNYTNAQASFYTNTKAIEPARDINILMCIVQASWRYYGK